MLSVLIPTYNYDVVKLVRSLFNQLQNSKVEFEIICFENGPNSETILLNKEINNIPSCFFNCLDKDVGRSKIRNLLAEQAKYNWLLFLDSDVLPVSKQFITKYIASLEKNKVVYGGLKYYDQRPSKEFILRWVYGKEREEVALQRRNINPNKHFSSANFFINKEVFKKVKFDEKLVEYGHEDTLLAVQLVNANVSIHQIDNPVYHLGLDKNSIFIQKTRKAVENLYLLNEQKKLSFSNSNLLKRFSNFKKMKMDKILAYLYRNYAEMMERNLKSKKPSLKIYDLYKLSYLCSISTK